MGEGGGVFAPSFESGDLPPNLPRFPHKGVCSIKDTDRYDRMNRFFSFLIHTPLIISAFNRLIIRGQIHQTGLAFLRLPSSDFPPPSS